MKLTRKVKERADKLLPEPIIQEASLSRVWALVNDPKSQFAVISAYLENNTPDENAEKHEKLREMIRSKTSRGYTELDSGYTDQVSGETTNEKSFLIGGIMLDDAIKLAQEFGQQSILWKNGEEFVLLGTREDVGVGKTLLNFSREYGNELAFDEETLKTAFSALTKGSHKGRKYAYTVAERKIQDFPTRYIYQKAPGLPEWFRII